MAMKKGTGCLKGSKGPTGHQYELTFPRQHTAQHNHHASTCLGAEYGDGSHLTPHLDTTPACYWRLISLDYLLPQQCVCCGSWWRWPRSSWLPCPLLLGTFPAAHHSLVHSHDHPHDPSHDHHFQAPSHGLTLGAEYRDGSRLTPHLDTTPACYWRLINLLPAAIDNCSSLNAAFVFVLVMRLLWFLVVLSVAVLAASPAAAKPLSPPYPGPGPFPPPGPYPIPLPYPPPGPPLPWPQPYPPPPPPPRGPEPWCRLTHHLDTTPACCRKLINLDTPITFSSLRHLDLLTLLNPRNASAVSPVGAGGGSPGCLARRCEAILPSNPTATAISQSITSPLVVLNQRYCRVSRLTHHLDTTPACCRKLINLDTPITFSSLRHLDLLTLLNVRVP
ncbi:hypothetical protein O3P69_007562 [Scylla paramamosain]|uniref:Uncharacterized protein n=1 Tax=Scylla paramamosain TaxID=85552 RepID=A0AAW0V157_SCYPA